MAGVSECPWVEHMGPGKDLCLLKTLEDGEELVFCEETGGESRKDESVAGPFTVCFDLSEGYKPVAQVLVRRGGTYKFIKEIVGNEALELHRTLSLGGSLK